MAVTITNMDMPQKCEDCRWFHFRDIAGADPRYLLDARCELLPAVNDWYGHDPRGGWIGEDTTPHFGNVGYYSYLHALQIGTRAKQCPLREAES